MIEEEIWKTVLDSNKYEVSNFGRIRSIKRKGVKKSKILAQYLFHGYPSITINKKSKRMHRIVMEAFFGKSKLHINHINGIKTDNRIENLEYVTQKQNNQHAIITGLINNRGENHGMSKLTNNQIVVIREAISMGYLSKDIAKYFKMSKGSISMIKNRKHYNSVT